MSAVVSTAPAAFERSSSYLQWLFWLLSAVLLAAVFQDGLVHTVGAWGTAEYSHGWLIPPIAALLVWRQRGRLAQQQYAGSWLGVGVLALGIAGAFLGELSTLGTITEYAFILALAGLLLAVWGRAAATLFVAPLSLLLLMVPLPNFIYFNLSQQLQLLSSAIGVWIIRLFGISVFLAGNIIDLGDYKLQVVDACSGLRYLFPLITLGLILNFLVRAPLWTRIAMVASTIPIAVLMNSFRIGVTGILVNYYGTAQAEGFLHEFEGWVIFMACLLLLLAEMTLLLRLSGAGHGLLSRLDVAAPRASPPPGGSAPLTIPMQGWVALTMLALSVAPAALVSKRVEIIPPRSAFFDFPLRLGAWRGQNQRMEDQFVTELKFTDYLLADYHRAGVAPVNLYSAYYASQRKGESIHSPGACLPGGGWVIERLSLQSVPGAQIGAQPLMVNRALISHGSDREVVYYWFQERGRVMTNEYLVKWYLFQDSLTRHRSDGALVRLIAPLAPGEAPGQADARLVEFVRLLTPLLPAYVPG